MNKLLSSGEVILEAKSGDELTTILGEYTFNERRTIRCPHTPTALKIMLLIEKVRDQKDSIGGILFSFKGI